MRLIDADAVIKKQTDDMHLMYDKLIPEYIEHIDVDDDKYIYLFGLKSYVEAKGKYEYLKCILENAETVDTVKHGRWLKTEAPSFRECSVCEMNVRMSYAGNYCFQCGSRMDEEVSG